MSGMLDLLAHAYIGVVLESPSGEQDTCIYVFNDGSAIEGKLAALIARDGYPAVFQCFQAQPSRRWREITLETTEELQASADQYPSATWSRRAVVGYGVLAIGPGELTETSQQQSGIKPEGCETAYRIDSAGNIRTVR